jgi:NhaP-type Na+/H+ or K+/H+ antiporter
MRLSLSFLGLTFFSLLLGSLFGLLCSLLMKFAPGLKEHSDRETMLLTFTGYLSFASAELCGQSGVIAIFSCGVVMSHYTIFNLSSISRKDTSLVFNTFAKNSEAFAFAYVGLMMLLSQVEGGLSYCSSA